MSELRSGSLEAVFGQWRWSSQYLTMSKCSPHMAECWVSILNLMCIYISSSHETFVQTHYLDQLLYVWLWNKNTKSKNIITTLFYDFWIRKSLKNTKESNSRICQSWGLDLWSPFLDNGDGQANIWRCQNAPHTWQSVGYQYWT